MCLCKHVFHSNFILIPKCPGRIIYLRFFTCQMKAYVIGLVYKVYIFYSSLKYTICHSTLCKIGFLANLNRNLSMID